MHDPVNKTTTVKPSNNLLCFSLFSPLAGITGGATVPLFRAAAVVCRVPASPDSTQEWRGRVPGATRVERRLRPTTLAPTLG